jgi:hypothetical protein
MRNSLFGLISYGFPLVGTFESFKDSRLRPLKLLVTLHIAGFEFDGQLEMIAMQASESQYLSPAPEHAVFEGSPAGVKFQIILWSLRDCPFN